MGATTETGSRSILVIACGALARELGAVIEANGLDQVTVECLPGELHNRPEQITAEVEARIDRAGDRYDQIVLGYADCGTGGHLDQLCQRRGVTRLPGAHCYEVFAGADTFARLHEAEPGTFYLTDYLARHFDRLVIATLGLDRHPELTEVYFGNYRRLVHLAQTDDPALVDRARAAADRLGLAFVHQPTGHHGLGATLVELTTPSTTPTPGTTFDAGPTPSPGTTPTPGTTPAVGAAAGCRVGRP